MHLFAGMGLRSAAIHRIGECRAGMLHFGNTVCFAKEEPLEKRKPLEFPAPNDSSIILPAISTSFLTCRAANRYNGGNVETHSFRKG